MGFGGELVDPRFKESIGDQRDLQRLQRIAAAEGEGLLDLLVDGGNDAGGVSHGAPSAAHSGQSEKLKTSVGSVFTGATL